MRFLFYDRIIEMDIKKYAKATKMVSLADEYFPEHYPRCPIMPMTLVIETLAQLAGWLVVVSRDFRVGVILVLIEGVRLYRQVRPGDELILEVWILYSHHEGATLRGEVRIGNEIIAKIDRLVFAGQVVTDMEYINRERERFRYLSGEFKLSGDS